MASRPDHYTQTIGQRRDISLRSPGLVLKVGLDVGLGVKHIVIGVDPHNFVGSG
jgi:hypothetical protein